MRALCGVYKRLAPGSADDVAAMVEGLAATGFSAPNVLFADERISVAQSAAADIDTFDAGDAVRVFADARIDGRAELVALLADPRVDEAASDAALIRSAWCKWGEACPRYLVGDYAFVIYDMVRGVLFCARDHVGARPFLYSLGRERFAFASDINALLALPHLDRSLEEDFLLTSLSTRSFFSFDRTWFSSISKLAPGHSMLVTSTGSQIKRFWYPGDVQPVRLARPEDYARRLRKLVESAVEDRLRGARRVGLHLSGGLDSTAVAAMAVPRLREHGKNEPIGFSWHQQDSTAAPETEAGWSGAVRAQLNIELLAPTTDVDQLTELLRRDITRWPDPNNLMNEAAVQRLAEQHGVDVILSGWGGDQAASFGGGGYEADLFARGRWVRLWQSAGRVGIGARLRRFLSAARFAVRDRFRKSDEPFGGFPSADLLRRAQFLPVPFVRKTSALQAMRDLFETGAIQSRLETWAASGARRSIEYRYPLLDRRVLDFCYAIPPELFSYRGCHRWLMRTAMDDLLPEVVKKYAGKFEPARTAELTPPFLEALQRLRREIERHGRRFQRARYVDVASLTKWLEIPRKNVKGQWQGRLALQFLDFPEDDHEADRDGRDEFETPESGSGQGD